MKCPNCQSKKNIKFFLRHQDVDESKDNDANVITILCTECGHNESFFLVDCLEDIFPNWSEKENKDYLMLEDIFGSFGMPADEIMDSQ